MPLDKEECRTALWLEEGNVTKAAARLKVSSSRFRKFVKESAYLTAEAEEATHRLVDKSFDIVKDALDDSEDKSRQDTMARFVITNFGNTKNNGGQAGKVNVNLPGGRGSFTVSWEQGGTFGDAPNNENVIDGEVVNE